MTLKNHWNTQWFKWTFSGITKKTPHSIRLTVNVTRQSIGFEVSLLKLLETHNGILHKGILACFWIPGGSQEGPIKEGLSSCLSVCPDVFKNFLHHVRNPYEVVHDSRIFLGKKKKIPLNGPQTGFQIHWKIWSFVFLNLLYNESLYC